MNFNFIDDLFQNNNFQNSKQNFQTSQTSQNNLGNLHEFYNTPNLNNLQNNFQNNFQNSKQLYQNTKGINTPKSYMVVLDSRTISSESVGPNFVYNKVVFELCDPIIIDSPTDIYLEFLHFQNTDISDSNGTEIIPHLEQTSQFYLDIDEFSINNISNNQFQSSRFLIPNETYGKTDKNTNDNNTNVNTKYIKLKDQFLCRIEANYITKLTITIQAEGANGADGSDETTFSYISNKRKAAAANYNTTGAVKIGLYFHKK